MFNSSSQFHGSVSENTREDREKQVPRFMKLSSRRRLSTALSGQASHGGKTPCPRSMLLFSQSVRIKIRTGVFSVRFPLRKRRRNSILRNRFVPSVELLARERRDENLGASARLLNFDVFFLSFFFLFSLHVERGNFPIGVETVTKRGDTARSEFEQENART